VSLPRKIQEFRAGTLIATAVAAIAAGTAIPVYASGIFGSPPPACYISSPTTGATVSGTTTVSATCGSSTVNTQFILDGTFIIGADGTSPFSASWNSATFADGSHTLTVFACDVNSTCVVSGTVTVTTSNPGGAPVNTVAPVLSGSAVVGSTDACSTGTWTGDVSSGYAYQWKDGAGNISGQTSSTYMIGGGESGAFLHCTVTATGTGGSASADSAPVGPVTTGGSLTTAHLWVSTAGSSACTRNASLVSYSTALSGGNVCDTGPHAYSRAVLGDNVLIESGAFTSQWNFAKTIAKDGTQGTCNYNYGGASNFTDCVTFEPASGQSFTFQCSTGGCAGSGNSPGSQIRICADHISLQNLTVSETHFTDTFGDQDSNDAVLVGSGDVTCGSGTVTNAYDIYLSNVTMGGRFEFIGGTFNTWYVGGAVTQADDLSPQIGDGNGANGGAMPNTNHSGIVGVTFDGFNFANRDPGHHHMECLHDTGGSNHLSFAGDRFLSCPVEGLFFETLASGSQNNASPFQTDILIENNYFDNDGANALKVDCTTNPGCQVKNFTVRFNTFAGSLFSIQNACNVHAACSGATIDNNVLYGNIGPGCPALNFGSTGVTGSIWTTSYNVQTGAKSNICASDSTSLYSQTVTLASSGPPNFNDDLSGAQAATNFVPNSQVWPATNIYGAARSGANTNAGAD
jgi:hypothetical protein